MTAHNPVHRWYALAAIGAVTSPSLIWAAQQVSNLESFFATIGSLIMGAATLLGLIKGLNSQAKREEGHKVLQEELLNRVGDLNTKLKAALLDSEVKQQQYIDSQNRLLEVTERLNHKQHELSNALQRIELMKHEIEDASHAEHESTRQEIDVKHNETQKAIKDVESKLIQGGSGEMPTA